MRHKTIYIHSFIDRFQYFLLNTSKVICSRPLWKRFIPETIWKLPFNESTIIESSWNIVTKKKLLVLSNFFFCHHVFKKPSAEGVSESDYIWERVKPVMFWTLKTWIGIFHICFKHSIDDFVTCDYSELLLSFGPCFQSSTVLFRIF